jgi:hypothetical protein
VASAAVVYATVSSGGELRVPFPLTDPDGNLATREVDAAPVSGTATVSGTELVYVPGSIGQTSFHVKGCDAAPWSWCAGAWVVVNVTP